MARLAVLTIGCLICAVISGYDASPVKGMQTNLNAEYFSIGDGLTMECTLGVGSDVSLPAETIWYHKESPLTSVSPYTITTDTSVTNGLFKTSLAIESAGIATGIAGQYRCLFRVTSDEEYSSEGALTVRLVTINPDADPYYYYKNADLILSCTLDASDTDNGVTWTGPSGQIDTGKSVDGSDSNIHILTIANPTSTATGAYTCTFSFDTGPDYFPQGTFADINVNLIDMVSNTNLYSTYDTTPGTVVVTLECQVVSPYQLTLEFYEINDYTNVFAASATTFEHGKTVATYDIDVTAADKGGTFKCRKSETEYSTGTSTLTVFSLLENLEQTTRANDGTTVTLRCKAESSIEISTPVITWTKGDSPATEPAESPVEAVDKSSITSKLPVVISSENEGSIYTCVVTYTGLAAGSTLKSSTAIVIRSISCRPGYQIGQDGRTCVENERGPP